jgi:hypothetical protein
VQILGVTGSATVLNGETVSITPTTSQQIITPTSPKNGITQATIAAVTSSIDANIQAGNIKKDVQILGVTGTYEGSSGKYKLLDRVKDDNNNEIGTVSGFFTDDNNIEYAVVCLDAIYRNSSVVYASNDTLRIDLPYYQNQNVYEENKSATYNTTQILSKFSSSSTSCTHCRAQSFTIEGTTYYGQLPNIIEMIDIFKHRTQINNKDTSGGSIIIKNNETIWSSTSYNYTSAWVMQKAGRIVNTGSRTSNYGCIPVLEIPNQ